MSQWTDTFWFDANGMILRQNIVYTYTKPTVEASINHHYGAFVGMDDTAILEDYTDDAILIIHDYGSGASGKYVGHTSHTVKEAVADAMGGCLFVDEAYSLVDRGGDRFSGEAVRMLLTEVRAPPPLPRPPRPCLNCSRPVPSLPFLSLDFSPFVPPLSAPPPSSSRTTGATSW